MKEDNKKLTAQDLVDKLDKVIEGDERIGRSQQEAVNVLLESIEETRKVIEEQRERLSELLKERRKHRVRVAIGTVVGFAILMAVLVFAGLRPMKNDLQQAFDSAIETIEQARETVRSE